MNHFFRFRLINRVLALVSTPSDVKMSLIDDIQNANSQDEMFDLEEKLLVWEQIQYETAV